MAWRLARSLITLRDEINRLAPNRSKRSDGTIGDPAHASRASRHNPNSAGVVTALDITHDPRNGCDIHEIADFIRRNPHPELAYIISNRRIASRPNWNWRSYSGSNAHNLHVHFAVGNGTDSAPRPPYDSTRSWKIVSNVASGLESDLFCKKGQKGTNVGLLQLQLRGLGFYKGEIDNQYGTKTSAAVLAMRKNVGSGAKNGDNYGKWAYYQLQRQLIASFGKSVTPAGELPEVRELVEDVVDEIHERLSE